jgi:hypothetical protein
MSVHLDYRCKLGSTWINNEYVAPRIGQLIYRGDDTKIQGSIGKIIEITAKEITDWTIESRGGAGKGFYSPLSDRDYYFYGNWKVKVKWFDTNMETLEETENLKDLRSYVLNKEKELISLDTRVNYLRDLLSNYEHL